MLLVASPKIADPRFKESVVLVVRHGRGGPLGVIVNKESEVTLASVFHRDTKDPLSSKTLHFGGPIEPQRLIALYRHHDRQSREALEIAPGIWLSQSLPLIESILDRPAESYKILAGFAAWAPGQLEHEIARGDWYLQPFDQSILFTGDGEKLWKSLVQKASQRQARNDPPPISLSLKRRPI